MLYCTLMKVKELYTECCKDAIPRVNLYELKIDGSVVAAMQNLQVRLHTVVSLLYIIQVYNDSKYYVFRI